MMKKTEFVDIMNRLREANDLVDKVNDLMRNSRENIENDFMNASSLSISHESLVVKLLEEIFKDKESISYWIYELDYGRKYKIGCITESDGTEIRLETAEELYDELIRNME